MSFRIGLIRVGRIVALSARTSFRDQCPQALVLARQAFHASSVAITDAYYMQTPITFAERLNLAVSQKHLRDIHTLYPAVVAELELSRNSSTGSRIPSPTKEQLLALLDTLGASGRPSDTKRIADVISDMSTVFGIEPTMETHDTIIRALLRHGHLHTVSNWLRSMPQKPGHLTPTLAQWHLFLESITEATTMDSFKFMRNSIKSMRSSGCKPTNETYKILIRARWKTSKEPYPHLIVFSAIVDDMKQEGLPHDPSVSALLYDSYAERGFTQQAIEAERLYRSHFPDLQTSVEQQELRWNEKLSDAAQRGGVKGAVVLFRALQKDGCVASPQTFKAMLRFSKSINDLRYLEDAVGIQASIVHWSIVVSNVVRTGKTSCALSMYEDSKRAGICPDAALVGPLIKALCRTTIRPPTDQSIDRALALYHDLVQAAPLSPSQPVRRGTYADHSVGPDANIYQTLLRALAASSNLSKYFPIAKSLMDDMEARNLITNDSLTATSTIVLLMRNSSNLTEAFDVYRRLCAALDEKGYAVVLNAFCKLAFDEKDHLPNLPRYFEMVKDMRRAGHTMTAEVYTILLRQLGIIATRMNWPDTTIPADFRHDLIASTRRAHDLLTLDASISPDAHVFNQLMDTYQRLGCFGDAYRVWEMMYISGRFDHISVSIILDACGHAGAWSVAKQVCARLFSDNFLFNQHNWNTWLECLCRLGKLNDAVKTACMEMGRNQVDVAPDVESAKILLTFARQVNQQAEVLSRIRRYLPELWATLPDSLRKP